MMLRYALALLLVSTYQSLGNPVPTKPNNGTIASSMMTLARNCENLFLSKQIEDHVKDCPEMESPYKAQQLACLMFYSINVELCTAVKAAKIVISEDLTTINTPQDVKDLCDDAKNWNTSILAFNQASKDISEQVFKDPEGVRCQKVCEVDDLLSKDSNFFCKYYKWGWEMLRQQLSTTLIQSSEATHHDNIETAGEAIEAETNKNPKVVINSTDTVNDANDLKPDVKPVQIADKEVPSAIDVPTLESQGDQPVQGVKNPTLEGAVVLDNQELTRNDISLKPSLDEKPHDIERKEEANGGLNFKGPSDEVDQEYSAKHKTDTEEQGDDDDVENIDEESKKNVPNDIVKSPESSFNSDLTLKESISPVAEGDDHFFPFFLTAIVLVVLLYVLYHNKNKVSKMVLGLLVEGRQMGPRRRTSRGHAYRRLDTLEQAMSANTAAAPSKIIY